MAAEKKTVLEYVKSTLSVMDSDEIDSITDTTESAQIVNMFKDIYYEFVNRGDWKWLERPVQVAGAGIDADNRTTVEVVESIKSITSIRYNVSENSNFSMRPLEYLCVDEFTRRFSSAGDNRVGQDRGGMRFYVVTNKAPEFWTSFDDQTITLNSYKETIDTGYIDPTKFGIMGQVIPEFLLEDDFIPDLPLFAVPILQASLNAAAMRYFKQIDSPTDNKNSAQQMAQLRRADSQTTQKKRYYNVKFGRRC